MNWYKIAKQSYHIWLAEQIQKETNNYSKPIGSYDKYLPLIETWVEETNPDLSTITLEKAINLANAHKYDKVEEGSIEDIRRNMNKYYANTQRINPNRDDFAVDIRGKRKPISASIKNKINKEIYKLGNFHEKIPLDPIFDICKRNNVIPIQEDGREWSGFLLGGAMCGSKDAEKQHVVFELATKIEEEYVLSKNGLSLSWCVMPSGKYEIVCYVS